jgi:acetylglutamate kinase
MNVIPNTQQLNSSPSGRPGGALYIIKIGGNIIDDEKKLSNFLKQFAGLFGSNSNHPFRPARAGTDGGRGLLVHGGGKIATKVGEQLGIESKYVDGRRITDAETLKVVTMVYAGYINKTIVAQLQSNDCNAIGLSGADGNAILAHKRTTGDYGFAGDIDAVNTVLLNDLLRTHDAVVLAPITHDGKGQLLNTNADTIAQEVAKAMSNEFDVTLIYSFEKHGVLLDVNDESSVIEKITLSKYEELKNPPSGGKGAIFAGMIPKLDNAFAALDSGVKKVIIGKAEELIELINGSKGTVIINE